MEALGSASVGVCSSSTTAFAHVLLHSIGLELAEAHPRDRRALVALAFTKLE